MKKTLIALAVGSAFAAPAAFADVTISGSINMGIEYLNVGDSDDETQEGASNFGVASNYSNVTISSMEDLGGGLKLDFAYQITAPTSSVGGVSNRNSHIGLVGESWGGVWWGSNEHIYERYLYTIDPLDGAAGLGGNLQMLGTPGGAVFSTCGNVSGTVAVGDLGSSSNGCGYTWYRRDEQSIWYDSPNWNGFTFGAVWQTNYAKGAGGSDANPNMWQLGAKYVGTSIPLEVWGAFAQRKDQFGVLSAGALSTDDFVPVIAGVTGASITSQSSKDTAWHVGAAYTLGDIKLFGGYEDLKWKLEDIVGSTTDGTTVSSGSLDTFEYSRAAWYIGAKWNLATGYVGAQFIQALDGELGIGGDTEDADDTGAYMIGLGYYHNLSKQTQAYIVGTWIDNKENAVYGSAGIDNAANLSNVGATVWGVGVGLKHSF
jgi:predicted porin